jgi:signal transduction histidine kinase
MYQLLIDRYHNIRHRRLERLVAEQTRLDAVEFARARRDYEQLVRHRIGNPLTVVQGVAHTLAHHPHLDDEVRTALLDSLLAAADELASVSLDATQQRPEERDLQPLPRTSPNRAAAPGPKLAAA